MPELPEVEVVCRFLKDNILNQEILDIDVFADKLVKNSTINELHDKLVGQKFTNIRRRGKYILFDLVSNTLVSHLRMEGKWKYEDVDYKKQKHDHVIITFKDKYLVYNDSRMFGTIEIVELKDENSLKGIKKIGYEYNDKLLTQKYLFDKLSKRKQAVKTVLLSQEIFTGLGNIYVDEVLFESKIMPDRPSNLVTLNDAKDIIDWSQKIMNKSIKYGGSTIKSYSSGREREGNYQQFIKVYGKNNTPCPVCGTNIEKLKLNGRGTHFCPNCQK